MRFIGFRPVSERILFESSSLSAREGEIVARALTKGNARGIGSMIISNSDF